jgi:hypothetical protein
MDLDPNQISNDIKFKFFDKFFIVSTGEDPTGCAQPAQQARSRGSGQHHHQAQVSVLLSLLVRD